MKISDIAKVKVDWMEGFSNDPELKFVLKRDRSITPLDQFRFRTSGALFFAEHEGEVRYYAHDRNDHNGFGGAHVALRMAEDWTPGAAGWCDCSRTERNWGGGPGSYRQATCHYDAASHTVHLIGPWSSRPTCLLQPCVSISTLEGNWRSTVKSPQWYHRMKRRGGRVYEGTYLAANYTLEFAREAVDRIAPHLELYEGDYGWYPIVRGCDPKNPRRNIDASRVHHGLSAQQAAAVLG